MEYINVETESILFTIWMILAIIRTIKCQLSYNRHENSTKTIMHRYFH